jgi:hypothetical protein
LLRAKLLQGQPDLLQHSRAGGRRRRLLHPYLRAAHVPQGLHPAVHGEASFSWARCAGPAAKQTTRRRRKHLVVEIPLAGLPWATQLQPPRRVISQRPFTHATL